MAYEDLTAQERVIRVHLDLMNDVEFSRLGGITQIGTSLVSDKIPTAVTNGSDVLYNRDWVMRMSRKQLRAIVAHESLHKMMHHCTAYVAVCKKYPQHSGIAMDYVVNQAIVDMDNGRGFIEWPTDIPPCLDARYKGMSWLDVLSDLLRKYPPQEGGEGQSGKGGKGGKGDGSDCGGLKPMDEHQQSEPKNDGSPGDGTGDGEDGEDGQLRGLTQADLDKLKKQVQDAMVQGEMTSKRMRGEGQAGMNLGGYVERDTDWRTPLLEFMQETADGDDFSRWVPPNRRMLALDIIMPSHYSEAAGEMIFACDTSGSMMPYYPIIFGEVGRFCQIVRPEKVLVIWWADGVERVQEFTPKDYDAMASKLKPKGGGGTTVSCVARYIREKKLKPRCTIMLTDGYIESSYEVPEGPVLWGVVDNPGFTPLRGKLIRINGAMELAQYA